MSTTPATGGTGKQSARVRVKGVSTEPGDSDADEWAEASLADRLPRLRASAAEWQKTVGTVAGLFGAGTLLNADATVRALSQNARDLFTVTAFAAFITVAASIVLASLAAQPRTIEIPADIAGRREAQTAAFAYTRSRLRASRWCAGAAMITLLASFAVRWYG